MESDLAIILSMTAYKIISLVVGVLFSYMGYKLFMNSVWGEAGDIDSTFGDNRIVIKKAAPGTFFSIFGAIIVGATIIKGLEYDHRGSVNNLHLEDEPQQSSVPLPEKPPI
ncbi:MAG: hypothetical protein K6L76_14450 [Agarilytica sp.]